MKTIIIVDDKKAMHIILDHALKGNNLIHVFNGKQALDIIKKDNLDNFILLTDIDMPIMNGIDLISSLRLTDKVFDCLLMSANNVQAYKNEIKSLSVIKYFEKPVSLREIKKTISSM